MKNLEQNILGQVPKNIDIHTLDDLVCNKCDGELFIHVMAFKILPATHPSNQSKQAAPITQMQLMCGKCHAIYQNPGFLKKKPKIVV